MFSAIYELIISNDPQKMLGGWISFGYVFTLIAMSLIHAVCFIDDKKQFDSFSDALTGYLLIPIFGAVFTGVVFAVISLTFIVGKYIFMCSMNNPLPIMVIGGAVSLLFFARYGRRTHKLLKSHMKDKEAHK